MGPLLPVVNVLKLHFAIVKVNGFKLATAILDTAYKALDARHITFQISGSLNNGTPLTF